MSDRKIYRKPTPGLLTTSGDQDTSRSLQFPIYEGLVTDVILDHTHKDYSRIDGSNVGSIQVRIMGVNQFIDDERLPWADPLDYTWFEMPLIGEMVLLFKLRGKFFYSNKISFARKLPENGFINLNRTLKDKIGGSVGELLSNGAPEANVDTHKFGNYWRPDSRVRQLKHFEGDILIQGRMGHSIRFGSSKIDPESNALAPNLILRTGQGKDLEKERSSFDSDFGLIVEDINKDASSLWMVSDQCVPLQPTTVDAGSFERSLENPISVFDGASILLNSDRLVLNSKKSHIMLFSNDELYLNSFNRASIDTDNSIFLTANIDIVSRSSRNIEFGADKDYAITVGGSYRSVTKATTSFLSNKIFIGSSFDNREPMVGGTSLSIFLGRLILALMGTPSTIRSQSQGRPRISLPRVASPGIATIAHTFSAWPPQPPRRLNPVIVIALQKLYSELQRGGFTRAPFNSQDNFVNLKNERVNIALNDFDSGQQIKTENNEWILSESYYKIT